MSVDEAMTGVAEMVTGALEILVGSGMPADEVMDLVPVKPPGEEEGNIKALCHAKLEALYART